MSRATYKNPERPLSVNRKIYFEFYFLRWNGSGSMDPILNQLNVWIDLGAKYVGGCCNVGSQEINQISKLLGRN